MDLATDGTRLRRIATHRLQEIGFHLPLMDLSVGVPTRDFDGRSAKSEVDDALEIAEQTEV